MVFSFIVWRVACPVVYRLACVRRIDPTRVLFVHDIETEPRDNFVPVMKALEAEGYTCVFYGKVKGQGSPALNLLRFLLDYPRARAVFLTEVSQRLDICRPRRGTDIVQLWHACGAFKKFGYSTIDLAWGASARTYQWFPANRFYTYACMSSPAAVPHYIEGFNCPPEVVHPWGTPRTDFFFRPGIAKQCRRKLLAAFPEIGQRRVVLYAPTFRGDSMDTARHDDVFDYAAMANALGETCALLLKPHPRARMPVPEQDAEAPFVFDATQVPIEVLLSASDLVITDYSSLIFEFSLFGRPMLFYPYDLEDYENGRSFYYPYLDFVPGDLAWSTEDIIAGIQRNLFDGHFDPARVQAFREKFMPACDGHSTARIIKNVLGV